MSQDEVAPAGEIERLRRRLQREREARLEAERIAERGLRELYEQRRNLQLLEAIAVAANSTTSIGDALQFALARVCEFHEWGLGHAWLRMRVNGAELLASTPLWHVANDGRADEFRRVTESTELGRGIGLPGRVWETGKPAWIVNIAEDANFPRAAAARDAGLRSALAFPVLVGDEVTAVLEFFSNKVGEPPDALLLVMSQIGTQLGRVVERKRAEDKLVYDASHDPLTGLPNRALLRDRLVRSIARARRNSAYHYAVLFVDLDRFKIVNDSLGHLAGDALIVQVAGRLLAALRESDVVMHAGGATAPEEDTLARLGGDEFIILLDDLRHADDALLVVERLQAALTPSFQIDGRTLYMTASIGVASSMTGYSSAEDVLRDADIAMYRAKTLGRARCEVYDQAMHASALKRLALESDLRHALENQDFVLHYQPVVCLATGRISGFEALVRWQREPAELVFPGEFIHITEDTGLIVGVGTWVLGEAARTARAWLDDFAPTARLSISVNMSARQFAQADVVDVVRRAIDESGIPAEALTIEITESVTMGDVERTIRTLQELKEIGVRLSLDDFGTGYSSLSYLHRLPLDVLKIDRSFIAKMDHGGEGYQIVHTIMALARTLGMDVVAEGTETAEQIAHLQTLGCGYAQGYFFSRPVDAQGAAALLAAPRFTVAAAEARSPAGAPATERGTRQV